MVKKAPMRTEKNTTEKTLLVRRGRVDSVDLFEVKEHELEILENGEPTGIYLNFSVFLLSTAFACILALSSATFSSPKMENTFLFIAIIGLIGGIFLLILWWKGRKSIKAIIKTIKSRILPEAINYEESQFKIVSEQPDTTKPKTE